MLERDIVEAIRIALGTERDLVLHRVASYQGKVWDELRGGSRFAVGGMGSGTPDLVGILTVRWVRLSSATGLHPLAEPIGRLFALEVKTPVGRASAAQNRWAARHREGGAFVAFVRSVDEAHAAIARARAGARE